MLILAVTNRQRSPAAPQVPTAGEAGFPDVVAEGFQGFFGWRDMPVALRDRIAADVRAVAPEMPAERLVGLGQVVRVGTTADFLAMIKDQREPRIGRGESGRRQAQPAVTSLAIAPHAT